MSKEIDWSKAPEGAKGHGYVGLYDLPVWIGEDWYEHNRPDGGRYFFSTGDDGISAWQKGQVKNYVDRPRNEWTGASLPPVGTVCEFHGGAPDPADPWHPALKDAAEVTVIAHYDNMGVDVAVFTFADTRDGIYGMQVEQAVAGCFRPIRTPEQIAAEEREKAIQQMIEDADYDGKLVRGLFAKLHDAGYRKVEQK